MPEGTIQIVAVFAGIGVLVAILRAVGVRLRYGVVGLFLIIYPIAISTYTDFDPWFALGSGVIGLVILVLDVRRSRVR